MASKSSLLHGFVVVDKPVGWTSHDVVGRLRRLTGERKCGHAGTLDPAATGVLPVAFGNATRLLEYLTESSKTYLAEITFGVTTDSYDGDGSLSEVCPVTVEYADLAVAMQSLHGVQEQIPPMHSAIQVGGKRLYELARQGIEVERAPRTINIHQIELIDWTSPVATVCIDCSKGTYIRSIASDLGVKLGCGAYLSNLVRIRSGPFTIQEAWTFSELEQLPIREQWEVIATHPDSAMLGEDALILDDDASLDFSQGRFVSDFAPARTIARAYDPAGRLLGAARWDDELQVWRPAKVMSAA